MAYELHRDPRSSHQRIGRWLRRRRPGPILDVGASSGQLGRVLAGSGLTIDGIEPDPDSAAAAAPFYRSMQVATVEAATLPEGMYGVVVCADVLEHAADPRAVLRRLLDAAIPEAEFLISVPNVAHVAARLLRLSGSFPRHDRGIFDRTHLHFYTRATAVEFVRSTGLEVRAISTTPVPLEDVWPRVLGAPTLELAMRAQVLAARVAPTLFAFQWIIIASRRGAHS